MKKFVLLVALMPFRSDLSAQTIPKIELSKQVKSNLEFLYNHLSIEFIACAYGVEENNTVFIERLELPIIYKASEDQIFSEPCDGPKLLGTVHSHIQGYYCRFSTADRRGFKESSHKYDFLYCEERIIWSSKEFLTEEDDKPPLPSRITGR